MHILHVFIYSSPFRYQRSLEGSACVFWSGIFFTTLFWNAFRTEFQFWLSKLGSFDSSAES